MLYTLLISIRSFSLFVLLHASSDLAPPQEIATSPRSYLWLNHPYSSAQTLAIRFAPPPGCKRVPLTAGSFGDWLRHVPLLPVGTPVRLYNGQMKDPQNIHAAVLDLDVGTRDLQQCADAVIRLRAEYQFSQNPNQIHFHLTSGHDIWFSDWYSGKGFQVRNEEVLPATKAVELPTHLVFRRYLDQLFDYAGTLSLSRELQSVPLAQVQPGDVLLRGGSPGHAVLVLDVAEHPSTKQKFMLLAQSYMPAQQVHVLLNHPRTGLGAWYAVNPTSSEVRTPEWTFAATELRRF
ncbi:DUF4846 domain-containing protein [Hymenobacter sp. GOD-10R]|uniref:DUF4846 domain-containing protein n=1 Tax=Hymenobacter sp. GOD-10R TaxID=3093922 RepID=UPI002D77BEEE|nr:DUF4846 domain-containing protein [Hymenobacter sp. GOD-10R]WRQ26528.1 DUF4846 domain-containing protein [Hymenobacter sp. GOD-10R]